VTVTPAQFRVDWPEFASTTVYTDGAINFWLGIATRLLNARRFQDMLDYATALFIAHNLALEQMAQKSAANGAVPGLSTGPVSSKTVGPVTQAYDTEAGLFEDAGPWNLTSYGTRLYSLFMMFGAGVIQV
jgi:hypothetical protein